MLPYNKELLCLWRIVLSFCLKTTQFACKGPYYQQVFVTAMGSPVSAVIANMVMEDVEQRALATSLVKPFFFSGNDMSMMLFLRYPEMKQNASYRI